MTEISLQTLSKKTQTGARQLSATKQQAETGFPTCFPLFAIKNRCMISLYKYSREYGPHPVQSNLLRWSHKHLERQESHAHTRTHPTVKLQQSSEGAGLGGNTLRAVRVSLGVATCLNSLVLKPPVFVLFRSCVCATWISLQTRWVVFWFHKTMYAIFCARIVWRPFISNRNICTGYWNAI